MICNYIHKCIPINILNIQNIGVGTYIIRLGYIINTNNG